MIYLHNSNTANSNFPFEDTISILFPWLETEQLEGDIRIKKPDNRHTEYILKKPGQCLTAELERVIFVCTNVSYNTHTNKSVIAISHTPTAMVPNKQRTLSMPLSAI